MAQPSWDTATMAELYVRQGHVARAVDIYRKLVREQPHDPELTARLRQLEAQSTTPSGAPMSFREMLQHIIDNTPGAVSGMIMGFDGIALEHYDRDGGSGIDLPTLLIEYSGATQTMRRAVETVPQIGLVTEVAIERQTGTCLLRPLSDEYFLAVIVRPEGLTGKARYLMRTMAPQILADLS